VKSIDDMQLCLSRTSRYQKGPGLSGKLQTMGCPLDRFKRLRRGVAICHLPPVLYRLTSWEKIVQSFTLLDCLLL